jgi:hypothetical protein
MNSVAKILLMVTMLMVGLVGSASAALTKVETSIVSGDGFTSGSIFTVRVAMTENTTGRIPTSYAVRVLFPQDSLAFQSVDNVPAVDGGGAGVPVASLTDEVTSPVIPGVVFRDVASFGPGPGDPFPTIDPTPILFDINFLVLEGASIAGTLSVNVALDPDTNNPFPQINPNLNPVVQKVVDPTDPNAIEFDNSATQLTSVPNWLELAD